MYAIFENEWESPTIYERINLSVDFSIAQEIRKIQQCFIFNKLPGYISDKIVPKYV